MEYHNSKDSTVAGKIFGLGLKLFADDAAYVSHYLDFLMQMNDDNSKCIWRYPGSPEIFNLGNDFAFRYSCVV